MHILVIPGRQLLQSSVLRAGGKKCYNCGALRLYYQSLALQAHIALILNSGSGLLCNASTTNGTAPS